MARFLFYMDATEPNLKFVWEYERTQSYLIALGKAQLSKQTQVNYLKSVKRFVKLDFIHVTRNSYCCKCV